MSELFTRIRIANVHFDDWSFYCSYTIAQRHTAMSISTGIEDDAVVSKTDFLNFINQLSFDVRLKITEFNLTTINNLYFRKEIIKAELSINVRFAFTEQ